ncbi:23S rRNA (guanine(1835)-N(2))-methyltransferase [hydrothermal vent metagenome]|uniref:23S rRNA (Guanine(1835)-N(2))-methyltransferase n=1 Tax=hydrothermal vent metagenome TaxID=652676 RepID=A0A3B0YFS1_9ZZZZ
MTLFKTPQMQLEQLTLERYPVLKNSQLRAWDAADEYILSHIHEQSILNDSSKILILNDSFGALSIALAHYKPCSISDSFISQQALIENTKNNNIDLKNITVQSVFQPLKDTYDLIIIKIPKNLAMLEDELYRIREHCSTNSIIIAAAMSKHIHTSTLKLFEKILGTTTTSLARKKARLVHTEKNNSLTPGASPYPSQYTLDITQENYINHANVFSREKLDLGSRFMLKHIPQSTNYTCIVDLACGNGVLGITAAHLNPMAKMSFVDESYMAVESAKTNAKKLLDDASRCDFHVTDCLQGIEDNSIDLILNNPPFHQNHVVGDFIAWQMFNDAKKKLKTGGELFIVGNRHLGYHIKLKKLFGRCEMIASNKKFVVLKSVK